MAIKYFNDPLEAIRGGLDNRAIGETFIQDRDGRWRRMWVVYPIMKTPYLTYPGMPGIRFRDATKAEVDSVKKWHNLIHDGRA
jgi:hypothetical protein